MLPVFVHLRVANHLFFALKSKDSEKGEIVIASVRFFCETANTKNVNTYYFAEIAVDADHDGNIYECRKRGFESLESNPDFLQNTVRKGSYGEDWSLRKVLRRFIWHDRIHARAMYRMAIKVFGAESIVNPFYFFDEGVLT